MVESKILFYFIFFSQPTRLNVFKNDQDTWDYTNPNLSSQGTVYPTSALTFLSALTATVGEINGWDWGILEPQQVSAVSPPLC